MMTFRRLWLALLAFGASPTPLSVWFFLFIPKIRQVRRKSVGIAISCFYSPPYARPLQMQQASPRSWTRDQALPTKIRPHWVPVWHRRRQRRNQHGHPRHVLLPPVARPHRRPGGDCCWRPSPRWYGRHSWMRQEHAGCHYGSSVTLRVLQYAHTIR
jgi:hypothetical protein